MKMLQKTINRKIFKKMRNVIIVLRGLNRRNTERDNLEMSILNKVSFNYYNTEICLNALRSHLGE